MEFTEELYDYIDAHIDPEPENLHRLMRESNLRMVHGRMCSGHLQGRLLKMLVQMTGARKILELGTFTGYSAICLAEGVAANMSETSQSNLSETSAVASAEADGSGSEPKTCDGRVDTIEIFDENEDFIREGLSRTEVGELVNLIIGDAIEVMRGLKDESYDMIFIDADKRHYPEYYHEAKRLLRHGGYIIADNTLWDGHVTDPDRHDPQTSGVKEFNNIVAGDNDVERVIIPLRDGLTIIRKR